MPYDSQIDRTDAGALIPEDASREIFEAAVEQSAVMTLARRLPDMSRKQRRLPVTSMLPLAYFVDGDTGTKQTTDMTWRNVYINAEEIAVIAPVPEAVLDDADYDIWEQVRPSIAEAIGATFDAAVLFGTNKPSSWPNGIVAQATAAGHAVTRGSISVANSGLSGIAADLLDEGGVISKIEEDGYMASGHIAALGLRASLRGARDASGALVFQQNLQDRARYALDGEPLVFPRNGAFDSTSALLVSGDFNQLVFAVRQDMNFKVLTEAVIQNSEGEIVYNLAQQDMVALRVTFRAGWALPNPSNRIAPDAVSGTPLASRLPFAVLTPAGGSS